jgi:hypothetical protein
VYSRYDEEGVAEARLILFSSDHKNIEQEEGKITHKNRAAGRAQIITGGSNRSNIIRTPTIERSRTITATAKVAGRPT